MKIKKIISLVLMLCICITCFAACKDNTTTPTDTQPQKTEEEILADCKKSLEATTVEILSTEVVNINEAHVNGYGPYVTGYDNATIVVIGITFPDKTANQLVSIKLTGETSYNQDAKDMVQLWSECGWKSNENDYALFIHRIVGEHDVSKLKIELSGCAEQTTVTKEFANNGETVGFENAKKHFERDVKASGTDNAIVNIKDRHYFIAKRYASQRAYEKIESKLYFIHKASFILIPLEGGFTPTLTAEDFDVIGIKDIENTEVQFLVNENGRVSMDNVSSQTSIEIKIIIEAVGETNEETLNETVKEKIEGDAYDIAKSISIKSKSDNKVYYFDEQK